MPRLLSWIEENWFSLLQSGGIIFGLVFTALSLRRESRARKASDFLALSAQHHELWSEVHRRPELSRVLSAAVDLVSAPITGAEEKFTLLAIMHFNTGFQLASKGALLKLKVLAADVGYFFTLPIPRAVWAEAKAGRDPLFVRFVENTLKVQSRKARSRRPAEAKAA